jgi:aldehyde dehydrogenase (NAD+)
MRLIDTFYIGGHWTEPASRRRLEVVNPATEQVAGLVAAAGEADVDLAVQAARAAAPAWAGSTREQRAGLLRSVLAEYRARTSDLAAAVTEEMGAPVRIAASGQVAMGAGHLEAAIRVLAEFPFAEPRGTTLVVREPIGTCALITPWNWPLNQIACKVAPALATGCTVVLKPSEEAPFSAQIVAEVMAAAGVPAGVFNLVHGEGAVAGAALAAHPLVDMVSITGSVRAGVEVARAAAPTVKRVHQELGGKSPCIVLDDADFERGVQSCVGSAMNNAGQSCNAATRLLVPAHRMDEAAAAAGQAARRITVGDPASADMGPVAGRAQWERVQAAIQAGLDEGARLVTGGLGRPDGLPRGFYVRPTVFADVTNDMSIARTEIFGPVLCILAYESLKQAVEIANDTPYGLAAYVYGADHDRARALARELRAGQVRLNGPATDFDAPFGGYKHSGNGREWGRNAFGEFLETKAIVGYDRVT